MSYKMKVSSKDRAIGRFKGRAHRAIVEAARKAKSEKGLTQSEIAEILGVDKSAVSRVLNGKGNLTLQTIGEISWVLGLRADLVFSNAAPADAKGQNHTLAGSEKGGTSSSGVDFFRSFKDTPYEMNTTTPGGH